MKSLRKVNALLLSVSHRDAGDSDINGKHIVWEEADVMVFLPLCTKEIMKYKLSQRKASEIYKLTQDVTWGGIVALTVNSNNEVVNVEILNDVFASIEM